VDAAETPVSADIAAAPPPPETFTVGVTDVAFNSVNAIYGRLLRSPEGRVVTMAYWQQRDDVPQDRIPYFDRK
jgi:S-adenosylmethionine:diacylglycerol 3-amino-3-carboxypropyl transferase